MLDKVKVGDYLVICSGKPHFAKERRKVTHIDPARAAVEVAGDLFDIRTGVLKTPGRFHGGNGIKRVYLAEGENLTLAVRGEISKKLLGLHAKDLKKVGNEGLFEAARLLGITLQP